MFYESLLTVVGKISHFNSFVGSVQGFPPPLSKEEEQELVQKLWQGDKDARDKLITHNLRLVSHIVKKFSGTLEVDDLISIGTIGLIKAIDSFKPGKNAQLATYASRCIDNEILMAIRAQKKHQRVVSYNSYLTNSGKGEDLELFEVICDPNSEDVIEEVEQKCFLQDIQDILDKYLDERERIVITKRFGLDGTAPMTQKEVAQILKVSRSYISRIETKALSIIKSKIPQDEK